jgi:hypothetical protein
VERAELKRGAAMRNRIGHDPKASSATIRPWAMCQAASFGEIAARPAEARMVQDRLRGAS